MIDTEALLHEIGMRVVQEMVEQHDRAIMRDACPRCSRVIQTGDWPWCRGNPEDHVKPHYSWGFGG